MIEIEFNNVNFNVIRQSWKDWLELGFNPGTLLDYNENIGKGILFLLELEKGLTVAMSDNIANDDLLFINKAYTTENNSILTLNYLINGTVQVVENTNEGGKKAHPMLNKVVLHHGKSNFAFFAEKGVRTRVLDIVFTHDWLLNQFPPSQRHIISANIFTVESLRNYYLDHISVRSFEIVKEILDKVFYEQWNYIFLKPRIMYLIEEFVKNYIFSRNTENETFAGDESLLTMLEIKNKVHSTLYEQLPNLKALAKEFLMSESTLSRRFKKYFGKTINEYYLVEKMELAKQILNRNEYTISQIAYLLGYQTVSAFNKSFKKHFNVSPGSLRKKIIQFQA